MFGTDFRCWFADRPETISDAQTYEADTAEQAARFLVEDYYRHNSPQEVESRVVCVAEYDGIAPLWKVEVIPEKHIVWRSQYVCTSAERDPRP